MEKNELVLCTKPPCSCWIMLPQKDAAGLIELVQKTYQYATGYLTYGSDEESLSLLTRLLRNFGAQQIWWDRTTRDLAYTIERDVALAIRAGVDRMTVHAADGAETLRRAVWAAEDKVEIVAVTMETPVSKKHPIGLLAGRQQEERELLQAWMAKLTGVDNVLCSLDNVAMLASRIELRCKESDKYSDLNLIVSASRLPDSNSERLNCERVREALKSGANEFVFDGRVLGCEDPQRVLRVIFENAGFTKAN